MDRKYSFIKILGIAVDGRLISMKSLLHATLRVAFLFHQATTYMATNSYVLKEEHI